MGIFIGLISGAIGGVYTLLYTMIINPDFKDQMNVAMQAEYEKQGMSEQQIEMAAGMASWFTNPIVIIPMQIIGGVIFGVIIGLIAGAIMKRDRPFA